MAWVDEKFHVPRNEGRVPTVGEYLEEQEGRTVPLLEEAAQRASALVPRSEHQAPLPAEAPNVPWETQKLLFDARYMDALEKTYELLDNNTDELMTLAETRLRSGYDAYGSRMYGWSPEERLQNALEEIADCLVYLASGLTP